MGKTYEGTFGIRTNTKGEIVLGKAKDGKYTAADAAVVHKRILALCKEHKLKARIFQPDPAGTQPVVLADPWGNPYLALLPPEKDDKKGKKRATRWFD